VRNLAKENRKLEVGLGQE